MNLNPTAAPFEFTRLMVRAKHTRRLALAELEAAVLTDLEAGRFQAFAAELLGRPAGNDTPFPELAREVTQALAADLDQTGWRIDPLPADTEPTT